MQLPYHNDQAHIAEQFQFVDQNTKDVSRLALYKISSYKLSLTNAAYCISRDEIKQIIKGTLLNYIEPITVLANSGFYEDEVEN
ncbi:MAG: hypothetical protein GC171_16895 [Terrimonas sp.]|nr:hypothetical protein [Terrimonas sp.]